MIRTTRKIFFPEGSMFKRVNIDGTPHFVARLICSNRGRCRTKIDDLRLFAYNLRKAFGSHEPLVTRKGDSCVVVVGQCDRDLFEIARLIKLVIYRMQTEFV